MVQVVTPPSARAAPTPATSPGVAPGSRGTLLIVEDNAINQEVARGVVAKLGYGSDVVGNGIEALDALEFRSYDAVLMDCHMPDMDGFQATAEIRRREAGRRHVPIIALTATALVEDREKCIAAGMDDYLSKPVKGHELEAALDRWLGHAHPGPDHDNGDGGADVGEDGLDAAQFDGLRQLAAASSDPGFLRSLVDQFLDQAALQLAALRDAAGRGDAALLKEVAHNLKGSSATMSAIAVASACAALEEAAARGEVAGPEALDNLDVELQRATAALLAQAGGTPS